MKNKTGIIPGNSTRATAKPRAFTLVELLVVIGVIVILMGILLVAVSKARDSANAAKCMSNMRQIGLTLKLYTVENRQYLPPTQTHDPANPGSGGVVDFGDPGPTSHTPISWAR